MVIPKGNLHTVIAITTGHRRDHGHCPSVYSITRNIPRRGLTTQVALLFGAEGDLPTDPRFARITGYCRKPDFDERR